MSVVFKSHSIIICEALFSINTAKTACLKDSTVRRESLGDPYDPFLVGTSTPKVLIKFATGTGLSVTQSNNALPNSFSMAVSPSGMS